MAAPEAIRSQHGDFVGTAMLPMLEEVFRQELKMHAGKADKLFKTVSTDSNIWQYSEMHDMPLFAAVSEGEDYTFSRAKQGYDKTISVVKYGLAANFSEELVEDSRFEHIADTVRKMAKSAMESKEVSRMNILNNGFSGGALANGQNLFSSSHPTPTGSVTIRNQLSTPADLAASSLKLAVKDFRTQFKGDSGIIYDIRPKYLVVPEDLRLDAIEIVQSELLAGTDQNNMNSLKGEGLEVVASAHLTDADGWFLCADASETGLRSVQRKPLETKVAGADFGFLNDIIAYKARYRETVAAVNPIGVFGTPGA